MIKYIIIIIWNILFYFLGIFIKYFNFNLFETQLFLIIMTINSLFNSFTKNKIFIKILFFA